MGQIWLPPNTFPLLETYEIRTLMSPSSNGTEPEIVPIARGLPASPGIVIGAIALTAEDAIQRAESGEEVILVRRQTLASDVPAMMAAKGVISLLGGLTCHAAIVARDLRKPCLVGCSNLRLLEDRMEAGSVGKEVQLGPNDRIQLDANSGEISWLRSD